MADGTTLQAAATVSLANNVTLTGADKFDTVAYKMALTGVLSGNGSLTKLGTGRLTLSGNNTYSGGTALNEGTLAVGSNTALGSGALSMADGTTLQAAATVTLANNVTLTGTDRFDTDGYDMAMTGVISGSGSLRKISAGTLTLSGANTYNGETVINAGTLKAGAANVIADGSAVTVASGATYDLNNFNDTAGSIAGAGSITLGSASLGAGGDNSDTLFSGVISGSGGLTKLGTGTLTLSGSNSYTGLTDIKDGMLLLKNGSAIVDTGAVNVGSDGELKLADNETIGSLAGVSGSQVILQGNRLTTGGNNDISTEFAGEITGNSIGGLTKKGTGIFTLSGANTYKGLTDIQGGTLQLNGGSAIADNAAVNVWALAALKLGADETIGSLAGVSFSTVNLQDYTLTTGGNDDSTEFAGDITGNGGVNKRGTGTMTLSGINRYTGLTDIYNGTLLLNGGMAIADTGAVNVRVNGTLKLGADETIGSLAGVSDSAVDLQGYRLTTGGNNSDTLFAGEIAGTGGVTKTGTGTFTLSGTNLYTGLTDVQHGVLLLKDGSAIVDNAAVNVGADGVLRLGNADETIGSLAGDHGSRVNLQGYTLTTGGDNSDTDFAGKIIGTGGLIKKGIGYFMLCGTNTYSGVTDIQAGTLQLNGGSAIIDTGAVTVAAAGTLKLGADETVGSLAGVSGSHLDLQTFTLTSGDANNTGFAGAISGAGGLTKQGTGIFTLSGDNVYAGGTDLNEGTLAAGSNTALGTGALSMADGTTLLAAASVALANNVTLAAGMETVNTQAFSMTLSGDITGEGKLIKQGAGTLTLDGSNSYTGGTLVSAGLLKGNTGSLQGDIENNAGLEFDQSFDGTYAGALSGTGNLAKSGTGALSLSGGVSQADFSIENGAVTNSAAMTLSGSIDLSAGTILNNGVGGSITTVSGINGSNGVDRIENSGFITSDIELGDGNDLLDNSGTLVAANKVDLGSGDDEMTVSGHALISEVALLDGGAGTDTLVFDGWTGNPEDGKGYLGAQVENWENVQLTNNSMVHLGVGAMPRTLGLGELSIEAGSTIFAYGASPGTCTQSGNVINGGMITLIDPVKTGGDDDSLTIVGNYTGTGTLGLDVNLGTGGYDKFIIDGAASGKTTVVLQEVGDSSVLIRDSKLGLISVGKGGTDSFIPGEYHYGASIYDFNMTYDAGTESYLLSNFILRNYQETVAVLHGVMPFIERMGSESVSRFHERTNEGCGWWSRAYGSDYQLDINGRAGSSLNGETAGMQVGADLGSGCQSDGLGWNAGVFAGTGYGNADVAGFNTDKAGELKDYAYSMGLYAGVRASESFWINAVALATYHDLELNIVEGAEQFNRNVWSMTASLEAGFTLPLSDSFRLEPQTQLIYQHTGDLTVTRPDIGEASLLSHDGLIGRLGIAGIAGNSRTEATPFFEVNAVKEFSGDTEVLYVRNNETLKTTPDTLFVGGALGIRREAGEKEGLGYFIKGEAMFGVDSGSSSHTYGLSAGISKAF
jgi:autotransporter-associated beta strand protein